MTVPYTFASATAPIPLSQLDSNFASTITLGNTAIQLGNTVTTLNNMTLANVTISSGTSNIGVTSIANGTSNVSIISSGGAVNIATNGTTAVTIDTSQNVGIGTSSPATKLQVAIGNVSTFGQVSNAGLAITGAGSNNNYAQIGLGYAGTYQPASIGYITTTQTGYTYGDIVFGTRSVNTDTAPTERMRIDSSGKLLVGTTTASGNGLLQLTQATTNSDTAVFRNSSASPYGIVVDWTGADPNNASNYVFGGYDSFSSTWMYRIYGNGTVAARSDARFKKNIETARNGYAEDLSKLRVVKYNWINNEDTDPKEMGLIAQEVEQVFPNLIQTDTSENGVECKSIKFSVLPIMLLKAIQEQQLLITQLQADIAAIKAGA